MTRIGGRSRIGGQASTTEWLELLAVDGPFLAAPVVKDVWPGGLPALNKDDVSALREASSVLDASPGTRDKLIRHVLTNFLGWKSNLLGAGHVPSTLTTPVPEYSAEVRPDFALLSDPDDLASAPLLLGIVVDPGVRATARPRLEASGMGKWPASFADRLGHALRAHKVPLGLVTDGTEWTLVCAPAGGATTTASWTRHTWFDEPDTLKAFAALLGRLRFFGVPEDHTLPALLAASLDRQEEITTRLSEQSRAVVEMLVGTIGRLDAEHRAQQGVSLLPATVGPAEVYQGAVTVLMRVVFLLYAEERGLLRVDDDTYADAYAISTLAGQLRERASDAGEDTLERSSTAWHRMLATFRAVHRGARHDQLTLPGYGGSLFDPDRFPWLEGRPDAGAGLEDADPLRIDDRTLLRALEALQWLRFAGERRRVSFRVLDVEQIGYVYEGLLDQDARRAHDWVLGVAGDSRGEKDGPEVPLTDMIEHLDRGGEHFVTWLSGEIKVGSPEVLAFALATMPELSPLRTHDPAAIWAEIKARQNADEDLPDEPVDLTAREYEALTDPTKARRDRDFTADVVPTPPAWTGLVSKVVRLSRLRETKAMVGFTRVDAPDWGEPDSSQRAPLSKAELDWVPASTTHGEGIFLVLQPDVIAAWERTAERSAHVKRLRAAHVRWRDNRQMEGPPEDHWPGDRYLLLHTLSHLLVREIALECGYSSASITERIYSNTERGEAAILLYTAASDSEGTLGGLVRLADAIQMDRLLRAALANARRCSSDPLCAEYAPLVIEETLHGAACHACLFASETTCERGNRFLDRRLIVPVDPAEPELALDGYFTVGTV